MLVEPVGVPGIPAPRSLQEAGLPQELILELALKTLHFGGELSGTELASRLGLPFIVLDQVVDFLKIQQYVQISGGTLGAPSFLYRITDAGRARARVALEQNHYVGRAPVPLAQYTSYMHAFREARRRRVTRAEVRRALSHLVVSDRICDQLGPAVNAGHSMFIYGPPGNGKTVISLAVQHLLPGDLFVPFALDVEGSIVRLYDPVHHDAIAEPDADRLDLGRGTDHRWIRCRRPLVMVGGELALEQLDLSFSPTMGVYTAPVQSVASGGVLVIDDFGRQRCTPRDLLNRWIVPLETGVDFLTLQSGHSFEFPFSTMIVFATNIRPADLVDEAFLRRIQYKIRAESPSRAEYLRIFELACEATGLVYRPEVVDALLAGYFRSRRIALRACQPRDLIEQLKAIAEYTEQAPALTAELLEAACDAYFVDDSPFPATYA